MFIVDEVNVNRILDTIESVNDTLQYSSIGLFKKSMKSIGFEVLEVSNYPAYNVYSCKGKIKEEFIQLHIYQESFDSDIYILQKFYYQESILENQDRILADRHNGLPSIIHYDEGDGQVLQLRYFTNDDGYREDGNPIMVTYKFNSSQNISRICSTFRKTYNHKNLSLFDVTYIDNFIVDASFCYNNQALSLQLLTTIIPDIRLSELYELTGLINVITKEQLKLIDIFTI